jgi:hypothetical protein
VCDHLGGGLKDLQEIIGSRLWLDRLWLPKPMTGSQKVQTLLAVSNGVLAEMFSTGVTWKTGCGWQTLLCLLSHGPLSGYTCSCQQLPGLCVIMEPFTQDTKWLGGSHCGQAVAWQGYFLVAEPLK